MEVVLPTMDLILDQITCMLCKQIPSDSSSVIYLCTNNHLYCSNCYLSGSLKGKKCRIVGCQESLRKTVDPIVHDIYCKSLFQCSYSRCPELVLGEYLKNHQAYCHYRPIECPSCRTQVNFDNYLGHLGKAHGVDLYPETLDDTVLNIKLRFPTADTYGSAMSHYHKYNNESFFVHLIVRAKEIIVWVQYYGDICREREFTTKLLFQNSQGHKTEITVPINPIQETLKSAQKSLNYVHLHKDLLRFYLLDLSTNQLYRTEPTEAFPGLLNIQVLFSHNYLAAFNSNLSMRTKKFGEQTEC